MAYLYREGNFMRAYEWSAWLFVKCSPDLKVTTRQVKAVGQAVSMIGFPPASLEKYAPKGALIEPQTDGSIVVTLTPDMMPDDTDIQAIASEYEQWKAQQPITDSKPAKKEPDGGDDPFDDPYTPHRPRHVSLTSVMRQILAYPLERKSPMECVEFVAELKRQVISLI